MSFSKNIRLFNIYSFLSSLDFYLPIKVVYFHQVTGSYATASLIISLVWIAQALCEVPTGIFSDLIGRKKTIVGGSLLSVLAYLLYAGGTGFWIFALGSVIEGAARSFFSGNNDAYLHNLLSEQSRQDEYHHFYGKLNSLVSVASVTAALLSGLLLQNLSGFFMWINLAPQVLALLLSVFLLEIKREETVETNIYNHLKEAVLEIKNNVNLRDLSLSEMLGGGGLAAFEYQAALYAAVWPAWAIGIARAIQEFGGIPSYYYAGKVIDKFGSYKVLVFNWISGYAGNILAVLAHSFLSPIFVMISLPLYGAGETANQKILQKEFTEKQRATIASLNSLGNSMTFSLVLFISGLVANHYGPFIGLLTTQVCLIPSAIFQYRFLSRLRYIS